MGILDHHAVDNGDVEVYLSYYLRYFTSASVPFSYNTPMNSIE